jgi:hypothetical protein
LSLFRIVLPVCFLLVIAATSSAGTHLDVGDDREAYELLDRLEAEGIIRSGLLSTKPVSRKEVSRLIREAERDPGAERPEIRSRIRRLSETFGDTAEGASYIKPVDRISLKYIHTDSGLQVLNYNNDGDVYREGSNFRLAASTRAEFSWFSLSATPEVRNSDDGTIATARKAYATLDFWGLEILAGRESMWWGPGRHGSLLLSNNMEPLTMLRLSNPQPTLLPWVLRYLGPFRFVFFLSRLEDDRTDVPEPILWGLRFDFRPHPVLEVGLARTAMMGGEGREESLSTFFKAFTGQRETEGGTPAGNQLISLDAKLRLPLRRQPVVFYAEAGAEDQSRPGFPTRWGFLTGIYLPRLLEFGNMDFRVEFATNHSRGAPDFWYNHFVYRQGYTYKGQIIGHHMGTDSRDLFVRLSYLLPEYDGRVSVHYDREEHDLSGDVRDDKDEAGIDARVEWKAGVSTGLGYAYARVKNFGRVAGNDEEIHQVVADIRYTF